MAGTAHRDVDGFAVQAERANEDHLVAGETLSFVDGGGVAVVDVSGLDVVGVEADAAAVGEGDVEPVVGMDGGDGGDRAVVDPALSSQVEIVVAVTVTEQHDAVTGLESAVVEFDGGAAEVVGKMAAREPVESSGLAAGSGEQDRMTARTVAGEPRIDGAGVDLVGVVGEHDTVVVDVGPEPGLDIAVTQLGERAVFPFMRLAAVDCQLGGIVADDMDSGCEAAAGVDFWELVMITDENHLGTRVAGGSDDAV
jgi:hypothetical protein